MNLPHGKENKARRIELRAEAIINDEYGLGLGEEPDASDINDEEPAEIEAARKLADAWMRA